MNFHNDGGAAPRSRAANHRRRPGLLARVALLIAAALPWYAMASGIYGLYFYALMLAARAGDLAGGDTGSAILVCVALAVSVPLAALLLLALPVGALWAACSFALGRLSGKVVRVGCVVSLSFAAFYAAVIIISVAPSFLLESGLDADGLKLLGNAAVLLVGGAATWKAWRCLQLF